MNQILSALILITTVISTGHATVRDKSPGDAAHGTPPGTPTVIPDKTVIPTPSGVTPNPTLPDKNNNKSLPPWKTPGAIQPNDSALPD